MPTRELVLDGLDCPNCSAQIEHEVNQIEGVSASMNFLTKTLTLEVAAGLEYDGVLSQVESIVRKHEPSVAVREKRDNLGEARTDGKADEMGSEAGHRKEVAKLVLGGAAFGLGIALPLPQQIELIVFVLSYIIVGGDVIARAVKGVWQGQVFSEHFLMTVATIGAFLVGEYPEGVAVMLFYLVGELLQDMAVDRSRKSISALMDIRPDYANLKVGDSIRKVSPEDVKIGDVIVVKPGEKVPLDGRVIDGVSFVDTAALTGESVPRELFPGSEALSGFVNKNGVLVLEVTKPFGESTVSRILDLVQNASSRKAPTEKFITRFARYYTPIVVFAALALAVIPPLLIPGALFSDWTYRALVFLVVSCPCALVISIPLGFFGGIGGASKKGVLVKGSNYLEALNHVETVVMDKTGTLTRGIFDVTEIRPQPGYSQEELLKYAAYAESHSNHPIAGSIRKAYGKKLDQRQIASYEEIAGHGIRVEISGRRVLAGNARLMERENINYVPVSTAGTVVYVAVDNRYIGYIVISDAVKEDAADAISELKRLGIKKTVMLTGDVEAVGKQIGQQLGLDEVYADLLPADKVKKFEEIKQQGSSKGKVLFVGDGINDAPVLAQADIGVAMGGLGSDAAIEAADVVIMTDEPSKLVSAIKIAKMTRNVVVQNIVIALGVKAIFLVLGAFGIASMWEAVFADVGVALIAIFNAMRVINVRNM